MNIKLGKHDFEYLITQNYMDLEGIESARLNNPDFLHGGLVQIYREVNNYDLTPVLGSLDSLYEFSPSKISVFLKIPVHQKVCIFDFKLNDGKLFLAIYYSLNDEVSVICESLGFKFYRKNKVWVREVSLDGLDNPVNAFNDLNSFFQQLKQVCRVLFSFSDKRYYYRVE